MSKFTLTYSLYDQESYYYGDVGCSCTEHRARIGNRNLHVTAAQLHAQCAYMASPIHRRRYTNIRIRRVS